MKNIIQKITLVTKNPIEFIDITDKVKKIFSESGVQEGLVNIITSHTTSAININEREEGLEKDMVSFLTKVVPREAGYLHDSKAADSRPNAHSHLLAMFTNASESIPITKGELVLGKWQAIFFIELDGPREMRSVTVQIVGE